MGEESAEQEIARKVEEKGIAVCSRRKANRGNQPEIRGQPYYSGEVNKMKTPIPNPYNQHLHIR